MTAASTASELRSVSPDLTGVDGHGVSRMTVASRGPVGVQPRSTRFRTLSPGSFCLAPWAGIVSPFSRVLSPWKTYPAGPPGRQRQSETSLAPLFAPPVDAVAGKAGAGARLVGRQAVEKLGACSGISQAGRAVRILVTSLSRSDGQ